MLPHPEGTKRNSERQRTQPCVSFMVRFTPVYESVSNFMAVALVSARVTQGMIEALALLGS
jgi:hypothetical protein